MNLNHIVKDRERLPSSHVKKELRRLLKDRRITPGQGIFERGDRIGVVVGILESKNPDDFNITVLVYGRDGQPAEVENIPITLTGHSAQGYLVMRVGKTNHRGDVVFLNLSNGDYSVRIPESLGRGGVVESGLPVWASSLAARRAEQAEAQERPESRIYKSSDGKVRATVLQNPEGEIEVAFETDEEKLANATVQFAFVSEGGKVEKSASVRLKPVKEEKGLWEGDWKGRVDVSDMSEPCELVFEVLSSD